MSVTELLEEKDIQRVLSSDLVWSKLSTDVQKKFVNERNWKRAVIKWSLHNQLRWKTSLIRQVVSDEKAYYSELIKHSMEGLMLFPYHLSDVIIPGLRISPFSYYRDMLLDVMRKDQSYDCIQNFTAADVFRLVGVGRNQFIDILNTSRSNRAFALFKKKENQLESLVPSQPIDCPLKSWWLVHLGYVSEDDVKKLSKLEHATVDMLLDCGPIQAGKIDRAVVSSLHTRGLVWIEVPVASSDVLCVTSLENFVMNRTARGDYMERLLYKCFVTIDEHSTVAQLAEVLQIDEDLVCHAMSLFLRLGFAEKKSIDEVQGVHSSWIEYAAMHGDQDGQSKALLLGNSDSEKRIGFLFDSQLTAFLMMGNLAEGLKKHAVMLYEVGKLADEQLDAFLHDLDDVQVQGDEGEAMRYFEHAITLKETLKTLRHVGKLDMLRIESLAALEDDVRSRVLSKNYSVMFSMAPMSRQPSLRVSDSAAHFGPAVWEVCSPWFKLFLATLLGKRAPPGHLFCKGERVSHLPLSFSRFPFVRLTKWDNESVIVPRGAALLLLNDLLLANPVFAQPYPSHEPPLLLAAFPMSEQESPLDQDDSLWNDSNIHRHPDVLMLAKELSLQTECGYVELVRLSVEDGWLVFDVIYGLPLFADKVAKQVLENVTSFQLLHQDNIEQHKKNAVSLSHRLAQFVGSSVVGELPLPSLRIPE